MKTKLVCLKDPPKRIDQPVYIGRGSKWGNPYVIGQHGDRKTVVAKYRSYLWNKKDLLRQVPELKGKTLMCFCAPDQLCHGQVLLAALKWHEDKHDGEFEQREAANQRLAAEFTKLDDPALIPSRWSTTEQHADYATQQALALHDAC